MRNIEDLDYVEPVENPKFTEDNTKVVATSPEVYNAYHDFAVIDVHNGDILSEVHFQCGPVKEEGLNGIFGEDLLLMIVTRLEQFQQSEYACDEDQEAIEGIYNAIDALRKRTNARKARGVQGTSAI